MENVQQCQVPPIRIESCNQAPILEDGHYVLYWMIACRRTDWNFSLQRAVSWAAQLRKPLVILEALRCQYPWACERFHRFLIDGMADQSRRLSRTSVRYYPFLESQAGEGQGLLSALASKACLVVTDNYPAFFYPRMVASAASQLPVRLEQVDSNGILPLRAADRVFATAHAFRRFLQKNLRPHLYQLPDPNPLAQLPPSRPASIPASITERWPRASAKLLQGGGSMSSLPIDHSVAAVGPAGGAAAAEAQLRRFLEDRLVRYAEDRNQPEKEACSGLSPYLHFGHISTHQVFYEVMRREEWSVRNLAASTDGSRSGWWGVSPTAEAFLDQLITWRELGFNMCSKEPGYHQYESLPPWALQTLDEHLEDERVYCYASDAFEKAATHDVLWNAAQRQLVREGRIHNYLRMLWGKKILEWSPSPREALRVMIELNNKYALDGRDPNSYSGIFWVLGRYDRPWGPERPIFGTIRFMSSENTARKLRVSEYVRQYAAAERP